MRDTLGGTWRPHISGLGQMARIVLPLPLIRKSDNSA